jgi:3',5'-cyclic-AMP phosphodiesterase
VDKINGLATPPEFMLHTGDISHLSKPEEFDTVDQILKGASAKDVFYVPGEHDVLRDTLTALGNCNKLPPSPEITSATRS